MDDCFRITLSSIAVSLLFEGLSQLPVVVDLAVEYNPDGIVLIGHGLVTGAQINDAQPTHCEAYVPIQVKTLVIGPTMHNLSVHCLQSLALNAALRTKIKRSTNSAHRYPLLKREAESVARSTGFPRSETLDAGDSSCHS